MDTNGDGKLGNQINKDTEEMSSMHSEKDKR